MFESLQNRFHCACLRFFILSIGTASNKQLWQPASVSPTWSPYWHNSSLSPSVCWILQEKQIRQMKKMKKKKKRKHEDCALTDIFWHLQQSSVKTDTLLNLTWMRTNCWCVTISQLVNQKSSAFLTNILWTIFYGFLECVFFQNMTEHLNTYWLILSYN